jgi:hypothetical protein
MVIGYKVEITNRDKYLNKLAFDCSTSCDSSRSSYYREHLLKEHSNNIVETEELTMPVVSPSTIVGGPKDTPWPMKCHDNRHTSQSPYSTANTTSLEKWRFDCDYADDSAVIDSDGTIYMCGDWNTINALYPNGTQKWEYNFPHGSVGLMRAAPAIAQDGTIYATTFGHYLFAINPDGTLKWYFCGHSSVTSSPAVADDGTIYFGVMGPGWDKGRVYAVNPNGTEKWHYDTGWYVVSDPAIGDDGTIYIGSLDNYLYALYPNGTLRWRFKTGDEIHGHPSIAEDGTIYINSWDRYLYAIHPNGTMKWKFYTSGTCAAASIGDDGTIYVGQENLYAIYPNGTLKWSFDLGKMCGCGASPTISSEGIIYFGIHDVSYDFDRGGIIAMNPDGTERWRKWTDDWVVSPACIGEDGTVYIGSIGRGYLHAFGPVESNAPPETPHISGRTQGAAGVRHWLTFIANDPDNNPIRFYIDWGDGNEGWTSERASGEKCYYDHIWSEEDEYTIRCKAKDVMDEESDWAELTVTMPRSREVQQMLFYRLLEHFTLLQKILCYFL